MQYVIIPASHSKGKVFFSSLALHFALSKLSKEFLLFWHVSYVLLIDYGHVLQSSAKMCCSWLQDFTHH